MPVRGIAAVLIVIAGLLGVRGGHSDPPRVVAATRVSVGDVPDVSAAIATAVDAFYGDVQRQIDEYLAWQHDQDVAAWARAWIAAHPPVVVVARAAPVVVQAASSGAGDCGSVPAAAREIYMHESGCNPASVNGSGCRGIGQACPGTKLPCGADFDCQHAYFEGYALSRYGSWENALAFWNSHRWW